MITCEDYYDIRCVLEKYGFTDSYSDLLIDYASTVEKTGDNEHGFSLLLKILKRLDEHGYNVFQDSNIKKLKETETFSLFDAQNSIGILSASECMKYAINKAKNKGMYTVFCRNCNTFGSAFYYSRMAIDNKCIGICMTNTPAVMAPIGGKQNLLGTNPISIGIPGNNDSLEFDMSSSVVSKSTIVSYSKNNKMIPEGWGANSEGKVTTNPNEVLQGGSVLPMGGYKGYGIALAIDSLCGILTGSGSLDSVRFFNNKDNESMNVGHIFICINPEIICGNSFFDEVNHNLDLIRKSKQINDNENILIPGDRKRIKTEFNSEISIPDELKFFLKQKVDRE